MDYYGMENWALDPESSLSAEKLREIEKYLNFKGYVVLLHKHLFGGRGPTPSAYFDYEDLEKYLEAEARPGDIIQVWPFPDSEPLFAGKVPNANGEVPKVGAY